MKTSIIISVSLFIIMILFLGHANISFKPFSISIPYWHRAVGITLVVIGVCVFNVGERFSGYKEGLKDGVDKTMQMLDNKLKEMESHEQTGTHSND